MARFVFSFLDISLSPISSLTAHLIPSAEQMGLVLEDNADEEIDRILNQNNFIDHYNTFKQSIRNWKPDPPVARARANTG